MKNLLRRSSPIKRDSAPHPVTRKCCARCGAQFEAQRPAWTYCELCAERRRVSAGSGQRRTRGPSRGLLRSARAAAPSRFNRRPPRPPHPLKFLWKSMLQRCLNRRHPDYPHYGGRGITVCRRWRRSFAAFCEDVGKRPPGTTLDRIDNEGPYAPGNMRWATRREQAHNRRSSRLITWRGETLVLSEWARRAGLNSGTLASRLRRGLPLEEAMQRPVETRFRPRTPEWYAARNRRRERVSR